MAQAKSCSARTATYRKPARPNFILIKGSEIITKPLTDEFLHGVTRDSVLTVAKDLGYTVSERNFTVDELKAAVEEGAEAI